jgi:hypothetical protein
VRNMSFALTTDQISARSKTVTRRLGWTFLKPGDLISAVKKCRGLKKGEKVERLAVLRVKDVKRESLTLLIVAPKHAREEVVAEGFPEMGAAQFVEMFCRSHRPCMPDTTVTRIAFEYVEETQR